MQRILSHLEFGPARAACIGMNEPELAKDLDAFNDLLNELAQLPPEQAGLLHEHLEAARYSLTGSMPAELQFNLKLANSALDNLQDDRLKDRVRHFIRNLEPR